MPTGLVALFDDIASIADDVAKMASATAKKSVVVADDIASTTLSATQKATGIVIDDMAVAAENVQGIGRERELSVVRAIAIGSLKNKMYYLVPGALILSAVAPAVLPALLVGGGLYLSYEGAEKVLETFHKHKGDEHTAKKAPVDAVTYEKQRIDGAIRTDMVLSGEIMMMGMNTMASKGMLFKAAALPLYGLAMTVGVYLTVAGLVMIDNGGEKLMESKNPLIYNAGRGIVKAAPHLIHAIGIIGTAAMLAVGGQLVAHHVPGGLGHMLDHGATVASNLLNLNSAFARGAMGYVVEAGAGLVAGLGVAASMATGLPQKAWNMMSKPVQALREKLKPVKNPVAVPTPAQAVRSEIEVSPTRMMRSMNPPRNVVSAGIAAPKPDNNNHLGM